MRVRLAPALATLLAIALTAATPALADDFTGIYSDDAFFGSGAYRSSVFAGEAAVGVDLVRQPFDWKRIEIAPGDYDFRDYDDFVLRAAVAGIHVLPVLGNPPSFRALSFTRDDWWSPPQSNADFADFAARLVRRYGPGGDVWAAHPEIDALPVTSWQIWNEPNLQMFWNTGPDASAYTALLRAASTAIHAVDPAAEVVAGGLPNSRYGVPVSAFVDGMFGAGVEGAFDTFAIHPYAADAAGSVQQVQDVRALLTAHGDHSPIWVTEVGWATGGPLSPYTVSESKQATNVGDLISMLAARRDTLGVRGFVLFRWRDALSTFDAWPLHAGLLRADDSPKPGFEAFRSAVAALNAPPAPSGSPVPTTDATGGGGSAPPVVTPGSDGSGSTTTSRVRLAITGGELSRYGFLRVHLECAGGGCRGRLRAGPRGGPCSGRRRFGLTAGEAAVLRLRLKGNRTQLRHCGRIRVTAGAAVAYLPAKAIRYSR